MAFSENDDLRAYQLEWENRLQVDNRYAPAADPLLAAATARNSLGLSSLQVGRVVDYVAYLHYYRVFFGQGYPVIGCTAVSSGTLGILGPRNTAGYPPGTRVLVWLPPPPRYGLILGAVPEPNVATVAGRNDWIFQGTRRGPRANDYHAAPLRTTGAGGAADFSAGRPMDSLALDRGYITETGLRIHIDPFMAQVAADEATGLFVFYRDQLVRLAAVNYQHSTSGRERDDLNDEGEIHVYDGSTPYPWEQLGTFTPGTQTSRTHTQQQVQFDTPYYAAIEPAADAQAPFHRIVQLGGYIGQGGKRMVLGPPVELPQSALMQYQPPPVPVGLFEEQLALTGRWMVRSAKGVHLRKSFAIPAPVRARRVEDQNGDTPQNYLPAGLSSQGKGPPHLVAGSPARTGSDWFQQVGGIADLHAYAFNWEGAHPLHYHQQDWHLDEASAVPLASQGAIPAFDQLGTQQYLPPPTSTKLQVDHRYGEVDYYPVDSGLDLNDDGTVVLGDGSFAEDRWVGGTRYIDAPGDIVIRAGRNIHLMAGNDLILRALQHLEGSSAQADIRLKAEQNCWVMAGNSGTGGVYIEATAPGPFNLQGQEGSDMVLAGVTIKAPHAGVALAARDVLLRTGDGTDGVDGGGRMLLDAGTGASEIHVNCLNFTRFVGGQCADYYTSGTAGATEAANVSDASGTRFGGDVSVNGDVTGTGGLTVAGSVTVTNGHIFSSDADNYCGLVGSAADGSGDVPLSGSQQDVQGVSQQAQSDQQAGQTVYMQVLTGSWYQAPAIASDQTLSALEFQFRNDEQYNLGEHYVIPEARWQQAARLARQTPPTWTEPPVNETYPYPGAGAWVNTQTLRLQDLALVDPQHNTPIDRGQAYEQAKYATPKMQTADGHYTVTGSNS